MTVSDWGPDSPAAVERDAPPLPPSSAAAARTPVPADAEERDGTEALSGEAGCLCHACGLRYRVDINVPDTLWARIGMPTPGGLLCGRCIADRLEQLGEFDAWALVRVSEDEATVDRIAAAMFDDCHAWVTWEQADDGDRERFVDAARIAVRTLREGP